MWLASNERLLVILGIFLIVANLQNISAQEKTANGTLAEAESKNATEKPPPVLTGDPQKDYIHDPNLPHELNGFDLSDYPFYKRVPDVKFNFSCDDRHDGFYASIPHKCQVYHHCLFGKRFDFLCANYTAFDQSNFICQYANEVDCKNSELFYSRNDALYKEETTTRRTTTKAPEPIVKIVYVERPRPNRRRRPIKGNLRTTSTARSPSQDFYYYDDYYEDPKPKVVSASNTDDYYYYDDIPTTTTSTTTTTTTTTIRPAIRRRPNRPVRTRINNSQNHNAGQRILSKNQRVPDYDYEAVQGNQQSARITTRRKIQQQAFVNSQNPQKKRRRRRRRKKKTTTTTSTTAAPEYSEDEYYDDYYYYDDPVVPVVTTTTTQEPVRRRPTSEERRKTLLQSRKTHHQQSSRTKNIPQPIRVHNENEVIYDEVDYVNENPSAVDEETQPIPIADNNSFAENKFRQNTARNSPDPEIQKRTSNRRVRVRSK